jgi:hypothetical protein
VSVIDTKPTTQREHSSTQIMAYLPGFEERKWIRNGNDGEFENFCKGSDMSMLMCEETNQSKRIET